MKNRLLPILFFCLPLTAICQEIEKTEAPITGSSTYTQVVEVKNSKDALFKNAQSWIAKTFGDYKSVIQFEDKEAGRLILKGVTDGVNNIMTKSFRYVITIDTKDNRYRCQIGEVEQGFRHYLPTTEYVVHKPTETLDFMGKYQNEKLSVLNEALKKETKQKKIDHQKDLINIQNDNNKQSLKEQERINDFIDSRIRGLFASLAQEMVKTEDF